MCAVVLSHTGRDGANRLWPYVTDRLDTLQRKHTAVLNENETLRLRMRDLETQFAQFKRSTGPDDKVIVSAAAADGTAPRCTLFLLGRRLIVALCFCVHSLEGERNKHATRSSQQGTLCGQNPLS